MPIRWLFTSLFKITDRRNTKFAANVKEKKNLWKMLEDFQIQNISVQI